MNTKHTNNIACNNRRLVADIGGTNARFALLSDDGQLSRQHKLICADHSDIVAAINAYLALAGDPVIEQAAIAIANPIDGDTVKMTNHDWTFSIEQTRRLLNLKTLIFKNDLTALAMAIPKLPAEELKQLGGKTTDKKSPIAVIAPGTGLGISGLINTGSVWLPLESEGGHVSLSPGNIREIAILERCWDWYDHVSAERILSGPGFQNLYRAVCSLEHVTVQNLSSVEISMQAMAGTDPYCEETLKIFCGLLGSVAGNLVLTLGAFGGVYIGGGIVPSLGNYFETSAFRERFEAKGRFRDRLSRVPAYVVHSSNPTLHGIGQAL